MTRIVTALAKSGAEGSDLSRRNRHIKHAAEKKIIMKREENPNKSIKETSKERKGNRKWKKYQTECKQ